MAAIMVKRRLCHLFSGSRERLVPGRPVWPHRHDRVLTGDGNMHQGAMKACIRKGTVGAVAARARSPQYRARACQVSNQGLKCALGRAQDRLRPVPGDAALPRPHA